jgi:hypothetical protein
MIVRHSICTTHLVGFDAWPYSNFDTKLSRVGQPIVLRPDEHPIAWRRISLDDYLGEVGFFKTASKKPGVQSQHTRGLMILWPLSAVYDRDPLVR